MKVLIIPDLHGRKFWRKAISDNINKVDKVIFLGDYLDPYIEELETNPKAVEYKSFYDHESLLKMLNDIVSLKKNEPNKYILLTGNHTDTYIWDIVDTNRTDSRNKEKYHDFFMENLDYFNMAWIEDDVLFSHAGITSDFEDALNTKGYNINSLIEIPLKEYSYNLIKLISYISYYRNGEDLIGSCEWADLREHYYLPHGKPVRYENFFQVFGHTRLALPLIQDTWACLDCKKAFIIDTITHEINER